MDSKSYQIWGNAFPKPLALKREVNKKEFGSQYELIKKK
jgi:hypothetical protein